MKKSLPLMCFIVLSGCVIEHDVESINKTIYNGRVATEGDLFSTVAITYASTGSLRCTAVVISPKVVLTAAHCVSDDESRQMLPVKFRVVEKTLNLKNQTSNNVHEIESIIMHWDFPSFHEPRDATGVGSVHDIALLIMKEKLSTLPVEIAPTDVVDNSLNKNSNILVAGFGRNEYFYGSERGIYHIGHSLYSYKTKNEAWLGKTGVAGPCFGDSGGPAYLVLDNKLYLVGIASRLGTHPLWCGDGGIYTFVPEYELWIRDNTGTLYPPQEEEKNKLSGCNISNSFDWSFIIIMSLFMLVIYRRIS